MRLWTVLFGLAAVMLIGSLLIVIVSLDGRITMQLETIRVSEQKLSESIADNQKLFVLVTLVETERDRLRRELADLKAPKPQPVVTRQPKEYNRMFDK